VDAGRIQAQVTASLAIVKLALDNVNPGQGIERAGAHRDRYGRERLSGAAWEESTEAFRRFVSLMGAAGADSDKHREQFATLFASSRWQQA
jgi:hypothetical protein